MGFIRQIGVLTVKDLKLVLVRRWLYTFVFAFLFPIIFMFFISYAKNFFIPPSQFGFGTPTPIRSLPNALQAIGTQRERVVFINNGFTGGGIENAISQLSDQVRMGGMTPVTLPSRARLSTLCRSTLRGVSQCAGGVEFHASPKEGSGGVWNYTLMADGSLGERTFVNSASNDAQLYIMPLQRAVDDVTGSLDGQQALPTVYEYQYTSYNMTERARRITRAYQGTLINILAVAFFVGICGITYELTGHMAREREIGMSQLIEAMMPNKQRWQPQIARLTALHIAFDLIYLPGWIIMSFVLTYLVFPDSGPGIFLVLHILVGLALSSYSMFAGSFFRKAQVSGITVVIVSIVLAIIAQVAIKNRGSTGAVLILSLIFPPCGYTFFLIAAAGFQQDNRAVSWSAKSPANKWTTNTATLLGIMVIQIIVYPILAALMERLFYNTASRTRKLHYGDGSPYAVRLENFSKHYRPDWWTRTFCCGRRGTVVKAVNDLTLNLLSGSITILLGANGSGKSTTLNAISGLDTVTHGTIEIDGTGGLGLCPQKNVMWDSLTVYEHAWIFDRLKSTGKTASKAQLFQLIEACDLDRKRTAKSKTLSGGQKRKLQLIMMFSGGSRVCCVDEVSSGIDPLARRKIWDILLAERGRRSILLTTHFLDEADVLSDHIAVLSKGVLKAQGSAVELKHNLGGGYRVYVDRNEKHIPWIAGNMRSYSDYEYNVYQVNDSASAAVLIADLERHGVEDYRVQGPTVEDVFLKLAAEIQEDFGNPQILSGDATHEKMGQQGAVTEKPVMNLSTGNGTTVLRQAWILFHKRLVVLRSNYIPHLLAFIVPVLTGALVTQFLHHMAPLTCDPAENTSNVATFNLGDVSNVNTIYGPPNSALEQALIRATPGGVLKPSTLHAVDSLSAFDDLIRTNYSTINPGGVWTAVSSGSPQMAYVANRGVYLSFIIQNVLNSIVSQRVIAAQYSPFASPFSPSAGDTLQIILYFGLAMCAFPGFFALYPTAERVRKVRALHYSNGIRSLPIWTAYTLFDFCWVLVISAVVAIVWGAVWDGWYALGYVFVVFFLYGLAATVLSYCVSLFVTSQLAAFAFSAGYECALFLIYFIAYLATITYAPVDKIDSWLTIEYFTISIVSPSCNLLRTLLLTLNEFSVLCEGYSYPSYPGKITVFGGPILYLLGQTFVLAAFLVYWDAGGRFSFFWKHGSKKRDVEQSEMANPEAVEEVSRLDASNDGLRVLHLSKAFGSNHAVDDITFGIRKSETFALLGPNGAGKSTTISLIRGDVRPSGSGSEVYVENKSLQTSRNAARNSLGVCPQFDAMDTMTVVDHLKFYARARGVPDVDQNVETVMSAVGLLQYRKRMAAKLSGGNQRKLSLAIALMGNPAVVLLDEPSSGMDAAAKRIMWKVLASVSHGRALLITTHSMEEADALANRAGIMARRMLALGTTEHLRRRHGDAYHVHLVHKDAPHTSAEVMQAMSAWVVSNIPGAEVEERTYHGQLRFSVPNSVSVSPTPFVPQHKAMMDSIPTSESSSSKDLYKGTSTTSSSVDDGYRRQRAGQLFELLERHKHELGFAYYSVSPTTLDQVFLNVVNKHNVEEENYAERRRSLAQSKKHAPKEKS